MNTHKKKDIKSILIDKKTLKTTIIAMPRHIQGYHDEQRSTYKTLIETIQ